jgi:threonylcarbamoyladenosine tRNA methylthiotransferase MtaB
MGRHYSAEDFRLAVTAVMNAILEVSVTTDVIVGFPGETDQDFEQTLSLCQQLPFSWIHAFPFSARPGTPAATLPGVEESVKAKRMKRLISLANEKQAQFQRTFLGRNMPVLWEREAKTGVWTGLTPNYMRVHCKSQENLKGRITDTKLEQRMDWALWGRLA